MKHIIIIFFIILFANCKSNHNDMPVNVEGRFVSQEQIFISKEIQDTLNMFVNSIDSIPNPYGNPTIYMVSCEKIENDTFIRFIAYPGLFKPMVNLDDNSIYSDIKGGYKIGSKIVVVYYYGVENFSDIINEDILNKTLVEETKLFKSHNDEIHDWVYYPFSEWSYKLLNGNNLRLLYKEKGKNEIK